MVWSRPVTTGPLPSPRAGHAAVVVGGSSGVLGEETSAQGSWHDGPAKMLLFGGGDGNSYLNDVYCLDLNTLSWSVLQTGGTVPSPRSRHTMTLINEGRSVLMLGGGGDTHVYNDVYVLDVESMKWSRPACHGQVPFSRWGHTSLMLTERHCLIYGGHDGQVMMNDIHVLDTHTWHWYQPQHLAPLTPGLAPSPRAGHTATLVQIGATRKVFVFGGGDGNKIFNDSYLLDVDTCLAACQSPLAGTSPRTGHVLWSKPHVKGSLPAARCAHTTTTIDGALVVFGGGDGSRRFKDVYVLDLNGLGDDNTQANLLLSEGTHQPSASIAITGSNTSTAVVPTSPRNHSPISGNNEHSPHSPQPNRNKPLKRSSSSSSISPQSQPVPAPQPPSPPQTDVVSWLGKLGMGKYADMFVKEEIDMTLLPHLTEKHLSDNLRVPTLGARLRILNAIGALKDQSRSTTTTLVTSPQPSRDQLKIQQLETTMNKLVSLISEASSTALDRLATRSNNTNTSNGVVNTGPGYTGPACK